MANLTHRGAVDADAKTGDGAGVQTQLPYRLFRRVLETLGIRLDSDQDLAVGMVFLSRDPEIAGHCRGLIDACIEAEGLQVLGVAATSSVEPPCLAELPPRAQPGIYQVFIGRPSGLDELNFARRLYLARRCAESRAAAEGLRDFYIVSMSNRTLVYKGLMARAPTPEFFSRT